MGAETSEAPGYEKQLDGEQQAHTRVDDVKAVKQAYGLLVYGSSRRRFAQVDGNGPPQLLDCLVGVQRVLGALAHRVRRAQRGPGVARSRVQRGGADARHERRAVKRTLLASTVCSHPTCEPCAPNLYPQV